MKPDQLFIGFVMDKTDSNFYVYLINTSDKSYSSVKIFTGGYASDDDNLIETSKVVKDKGELKAEALLKIDQSDWDELDFVIWYHLDLMDEAGTIHKYWFQLPKYGWGYDEKVTNIPILEKSGMIIELEKRMDGKSIDEEIKTVKMESQYHDFSKKHDTEISVVEKAARIAVAAHSGQTRKGDGMPYIVHPFMVALKLSKHGFSDEVIAAALTHDVLEDTEYGEEKLRSELGDDVCEIVKAVTNDDSLSWEEKKKKYVDSVRKGSNGAKAVAVADKIHNLESLFLAHAEQGSDVWKKFNRGKEQKLWFENEVLKMLKETWDHPLVSEYEKLLEIEKELN